MSATPAGIANPSSPSRQEVQEEVVSTMSIRPAEPASGSRIFVCSS